MLDLAAADMMDLPAFVEPVKLILLQEWVNI